MGLKILLLDPGERAADDLLSIAECDVTRSQALDCSHKPIIKREARGQKTQQNTVLPGTTVYGLNEDFIQAAPSEPPVVGVLSVHSPLQRGARRITIEGPG